MLAAAATLLGASAVHGSLVGPIDPFPGAAIPEAVIGVVLGAAAFAGLALGRSVWPYALGATLFAIAGTLYGLTVTVPRGDPGDIAYHLALLATLAVTIGLLLVRRE